MFRRATISIVAALTASSSAFARLGENDIQCADRYGGTYPDTLAKHFPLIPGATHREYHYKGWVIRCAFVDGVVAREEYRKVIAPGVSPTIADFEIAAILDAEAAGKTWTERGKLSTFNPQEQFKRMAMEVAGEKVWLRPDGPIAVLLAGKLAIRLETPAAAGADAKHKKEQEEKQRATVPKF
ncbi:hypothetical protein AYO41_03165 [Verrucomicrobia bacterium SCGC AG-212-E04]|nr:hypothetical protein AYO41_03165 [Verrucomicrobia bacterium SCGC AG-212-E04]